MASEQTNTRKRGTPRLPIPKRTNRTDSRSYSSRSFVAGAYGRAAVAAVPPKEPSGIAAANVAESRLGNATQPSAPAPSAAPDLRSEKTMTVKEAAWRLCKSKDAIYKWLKTGRLQAWQPGGRCCAVMVTAVSVERAASYKTADSR